MIVAAALLLAWTFLAGCLAGSEAPTLEAPPTPVEVMEEPKAEPRAAASASPSVPSQGGPPDPSAALGAALARLPTGRILYNPPSEMRVGEAERVEVRVSRDLQADLTAGLKGEGAPQVEPVAVGLTMKVVLTGEGFQVLSLNEAEQFVGTDTFTQWAFDVTPEESGVQRLTLRVTVTAQGEGRTVSRDLPVMERDVQVQVNPPLLVKRFVLENVEFLGGAVFLPLVAWIFSKLRRRKDPEPS